MRAWAPRPVSSECRFWGAARSPRCCLELKRAGFRAHTPIPVIVGLPEERPGWGEPEQREVVAALAAISSPELPLAPEALPAGHAAALDALRSARERIVTGATQSPLVIVGGIDSYHTPPTLRWLDGNRQWFGPDVRSGFVPGEGAAFVALMRGADATGMGLELRASVDMVASAREDKLLKSDDLSLGEGLTAAVAQALAAVNSPDRLVDEIYCDMNGERYRSEEWGFVALRLATSFRDVADYRTAVGSWGDSGAATGALNLVLATQAWRRGYSKGASALVWGSSEGGLRAAALLGAPAPRARAGETA